MADPKIELHHNKFGDYEYRIVLGDRVLYCGSASRHRTCLAAARRNLKWIKEKLAKGEL